MSLTDPPVGRRKPGGSAGRRSGVWAQAQVFAAGGTEFGGTVAVLCLLGWWLDKRWGTSPTLILTGLVIGVVGGTIKLFRLQSAMYRAQPGPNTGPDPEPGAADRRRKRSTEPSDGPSEERGGE